MENISLSRADLAPTLNTHLGGKVFAQAISEACETRKLLIIVGRYIHFNSVFGGGVANLAGEIAVRQDLFRDTKEGFLLLSDRSTEVSTLVFQAAVDEFDDRGTTFIDTHRTLAQATLKGFGMYFGYSTKEMNEIIRINLATKQAIEDVKRGYGLNSELSEQRLFNAIGFHMGSEILADEEFRQLDGFLRIEHPQLVESLEATQVEINNGRHVAYYWVRIHTSVEADHFEYAAQAANAALMYYVGAETKAQVKQWILDGFSQFAKVHTEFMNGLLLDV